MSLCGSRAKELPETEIERMKDEVSVQRLVEAAGVGLKKAGKDWLGCCPFHDDAEASLVITPTKNLWHCFGCQVGGGPIDWVMKSRGVSFCHAVELLKADAGLAAAAVDGEVKRSKVRTLPSPVAFDADDRACQQFRVRGGLKRISILPRTGFLTGSGLLLSPDPGCRHAVSRWTP